MFDSDSGGMIRVGTRLFVSSCMLGQTVRYGGHHTRHDWLVDTLDRCVDFRPLSPQVSIGLDIPRERVHLTGDAEHPGVRAITNPDRDVPPCG